MTLKAGFLERPHLRALLSDPANQRDLPVDASSWAVLPPGLRESPGFGSLVNKSEIQTGQSHQKGAATPVPCRENKRAKLGNESFY